MKLPSGPHIKPSREQYLESRVSELKIALDIAQQRIDDLEKALGIGDDIGPICRMGFTEQEAKLVNALVKLPVVSRQALNAAAYDEVPDRRFDVQDKSIDVVLCRVRQKLARLGVEIEQLGFRNGWRITLAGKARLARLVASGARIDAGRPSDMRHAANRRPRASNGVFRPSAE